MLSTRKKITQKQKKFIESLMVSFKKLLFHFNRVDDPVFRYVDRLRMREIQQSLEKFGIVLKVP